MGMSDTTLIANISPKLVELCASWNALSASGTVYMRGLGQVDELAEEVVPGPDEGEDRRRSRAPGTMSGRMICRKMRGCPAAVDARGLVEFARDAADELHHEEDEERVGREQLRHDERQERVDPAELREQHVLRHDDHVDRQHDAAAA